MTQFADDPVCSDSNPVRSTVSEPRRSLSEPRQPVSSDSAPVPAPGIWKINRRTTVKRASIASSAGRHIPPAGWSRQGGVQVKRISNIGTGDFVRNAIATLFDADDATPTGDNSFEKTPSRPRLAVSPAVPTQQKLELMKSKMHSAPLAKRPVKGQGETGNDGTNTVPTNALLKARADRAEQKKLKRAVSRPELKKRETQAESKESESHQLDPVIWLKHKKNLEGIMFKAERASRAHASQMKRPSSSPGLRSFVDQFISLGQAAIGSAQKSRLAESAPLSPLKASTPSTKGQGVLSLPGTPSRLAKTFGQRSPPSASSGLALSMRDALGLDPEPHKQTVVKTPKRTFVADDRVRTQRATITDLPREVVRTSRPRPQSAPGGGGVTQTVRSLVPDLQLNGIGDDFDEQRRHAQMPMLPEGKLMLLLKQRDFKSVFRALREHFMTEFGDSLEAADAVANAERILLGTIRMETTRQVLLCWIMGACLEGLGQEQAAIRFFARCTNLDRQNPMHPYNRGICQLTLGNRDAAHVDFCLAVELCLKREQAPPSDFYICRALSAAAMAKEGRHVWADFELCRQRIQNPGQAFLSISQGVHRAGGFPAYSSAVIDPMPLASNQQHYLSVIIAQAREREEEFTPNEQKAFLRFLRRMPEMALIPREVLCRNMHFFTVHTVAEGQPLFPTNNWHCIMAGKFSIFRFTTLNDACCNQGSASASSLDENSDWLQLPPMLWTPQNWERVGSLETHTCFKGGQEFGPQGDGWLVADETTEVLLFPLACIDRMKRKINSEQNEDLLRDVDFLAGVELFRNLPMRLLCSMLEEFIERHEAISGEDPLGMWPGLVIVRKGQLQLTLKTEVEDAEQRSKIKKQTHDRSAWLGGSKMKNQTHDHAKPLCVLEAGDCVGEETLLGGTGLSQVCSSEVVSIRAEFWVLSQEKQESAEQMGLLEFLTHQREPNLQAIERKIDAAEDWQRQKKKTLESLRGRVGTTVDESRTPINPMPGPRGGAVLSWSDRPSPTDP